jgi:cell division GTPase FtsZ
LRLSRKKVPFSIAWPTFFKKLPNVGELGGVKMKNERIETLTEVVERIKAPYENLDEPVTVVIGIGGAGNNLVNHLSKMGIEGITTIGINTDERHLAEIEADKKMYIGKTITRGRGSGGHKEIGSQAAELAADSLSEMVKDSDIVFLIAGLGGGTGTGATPVIGRLAKAQGALVIGIGILPFAAESTRRKRAKRGFNELKKVAESTILLDNNKLLDIAPDLSAEEGLNVMNSMISKIIINTRSTLVQTIMAAKSLNVDEIIGDMPAQEIEEKEAPPLNTPDIVAPVPIHAQIPKDDAKNPLDNIPIGYKTTELA